jgi:DNA-binding NarL/FixJ family response regulator
MRSGSGLSTVDVELMNGTEPATGHPSYLSAAVEPFAMTVVLADEQPVVRWGLRTLLSGTPDMAVIAEAATARDTVELAVLHRPDVLVVDIDLPGFQVDGMFSEVRRRTPSTAILVFSAIDADDTVVAAVRAGVRGYLLKSSSNETVVRAIRGLAAGEVVLGPGVAERLMSRVSSRPSHQQMFPELTAREQDVLELMALGLANAAIAARLHLSAKTIANRISRIYGKLQVADRRRVIELVHSRTRERGDRPPPPVLGRVWPDPEPARL